MKEKGISKSQFLKDNHISNAAFEGFFFDSIIEGPTLLKLCRYFNAEPCELFEYVDSIQYFKDKENFLSIDSQLPQESNWTGSNESLELTLAPLEAWLRVSLISKAKANKMLGKNEGFLKSKIKKGTIDSKNIDLICRTFRCTVREVIKIKKESNAVVQNFKIGDDLF